MSTATYLTPERYASIVNLPICLPETELRRGVDIQIASFKLTSGQVAVVRVMDMNIVRVLTPGIIPDSINSAFGWCYAGVFAGYMAASPFIAVSAYQAGVTGLQSSSAKVIASPGLYTVRLVNNTGTVYTKAIDLSVCVTGAIKIYQ